MNDLITRTFEEKNVEMLILNDEALFNPYDVGECLNISEATVRSHLAQMTENHKIILKNSDVDLTNIRKLNNAGESFLTESGLYQFIFKSRKPEAQKFVAWVTDEVLPSIRKTGSYGIEQKENRLINNLLSTTEQLLGIRREELAILQSESPQKKLSNLMIDCSKNGMGSLRELYDELFLVFAAETGIEVEDIARNKGLERRVYVKQNPALAEMLFKFAHTHFNRFDRQVILVPLDVNQKTLEGYIG